MFGEDGACRSLEASAGTTARQLCETLVRRTRALQDHSWALVEQHQHLALGEPPARHGAARRGAAWHWVPPPPAAPLSPVAPAERCLEDHESVVEVQSSWPPGADSRFVFRKNFAKYELFKSNAVRGRRSKARGDTGVPRQPGCPTGIRMPHGDPEHPVGLP